MGLHENEPKAMPQCLALSAEHAHVQHAAAGGGTRPLAFTTAGREVGPNPAATVLPMLPVLQTDLLELLNV